MEPYEKKRLFERFDLAMTGVINSGSIDREIKAVTRDISAGGAFFKDVSELDEGMKVKIELVIGNETVKKLTGSISRVKLLGKVVRSSPEGAAVKFNGNYEILPLRSQLYH